MTATPAGLYRAHVLNLRAVRSGIDHLERHLGAAIARQDNDSATTLLKILLLLAGSWAECRLKKLLYEPSGFNSLDRTKILTGRSLLEHWQAALDTGYRKKYNVRKAGLSDQTLGATAWFRYTALRSVIQTELKPIIEMRNALAHGQWERPLNSDETDINGSMIATIQKENALSARFKLSLLDALASLIHDLVAAQTAFERDYDEHFAQIIATRRNLVTRDYNHWQNSMRKKYERGQRKRDENIAQYGVH